MLSTLEANFLQEYKVCGNATKALRNAGVNLPDKSLKVKACRMLKKPEVQAIIQKQHDNLLSELTKPAITIVNQKVIELPSKEQFAQVAWKRAGDDSPLKEDTKHKYFETTGKVLGHIGRDENKSEADCLTIICKELNLSLSVPHNDLKLSQNDLRNNQIDITAHDVAVPAATEGSTAPLTSTEAEFKSA